MPMKSPRPKKALSRTHFYELLGVEKSATEQEIKKAYRKKALQSHPDKPGGNRQLFEEIKYASDVLSDSSKRACYDRYGEIGVKIMENNNYMDSAEMALQLFLSIGACERFLLILLLTLLIGYFLLFPILLCIRWDHPRTMSFAHVFIPVWLGLVLVLCFCICCVRVPSAPETEDNDEQARKEHEEEQKKRDSVRNLKWGSSAVIFILGLLMAFLVLRLDGETKCSYFLVLWPWMLLELGLFAIKCWPEALISDKGLLEQHQKMLTKDLHFVVNASSHFFHIVFACLLALKMDGTYQMSWWEVFTPIWVHVVLAVVMFLSKCGSVKTEEELNDMPPEERALQFTRGTIVVSVILEFFWLGCALLVCWKLSHPSAFAAWVIFVPLFAIAGCFCCCLSCVFCCMGPDYMRYEEDEETGEGSPMTSNTQPSQQPKYGSMK